MEVLIRDRYTNRVIWEGMLEKLPDAMRNKTYNFSNADLSNLDFHELDLGNVYFVNADLTNSSFANANLSNAHFVGCNIFRTYFVSADLTDACFYTTSLCRSSFEKSNLYSVLFMNVVLSDSTFSYANMTNVRFDGVDLTNTNFHSATIRGNKIHSVLSIGPMRTCTSYLTVWVMEDGTELYSAENQCQNTKKNFLDGIKNFLDDMNTTNSSSERCYIKDYISAVKFSRSWSKRGVKHSFLRNLLKNFILEDGTRLNC